MEFDFNALDYRLIEQKLVEFIRSFAGGKKIVMGLSGGIDSSVSSTLAIKALGKDNVKVVIAKNTQFTKEGIDIARVYAQKIGAEVQEVDTEGVRDTILKSLSIVDSSLILQASVDVRLCDLILRTVAQTEGRLYMGTINSTERIVGWYPKGTLVGDFCPIGGMLKHQLKGLANYMGLEDLAEGVSKDASIVCGGCGELPEFSGIPYSTLDTALYLYETTPEGKLVEQLDKYKIKQEQWQVILNRIDSVSHKSEYFPDYCKINVISS